MSASSPQRAEAFPTLNDLQQTISKLVDRLGYEPNTTSEIKAALLTRIQSLRIGGKGKMLDTRESFSMNKLLEKPTVLELEEIGDDDEKAFLIGLILVRLYEYLKSQGISTDGNLKHVVVVEEAHRLLSNVPMYTSADVANTRGKAVETFVNMLSEVRAYGEGFMVAEQIHSKLNPDVIKNTNIKIVHRTVAGDDRVLISQAITMKERESDILGTLTVGESIIFTEGDDRPIMVKTPKYEKGVAGTQRETTDIARLDAENVAKDFPEVTLDCLAGCKKHSGIVSFYCDLSQEMAETAEFQNMISYYISSTVEEPESISEILPSILERAQRYHPGLRESEDFIKSLLIHTISLFLRIMGHNYCWSFEGVTALKDLLIPISLEALQGLKPGKGSISCDRQRISEFQDRYIKMCVRGFDPFPACRSVCDQEPSPLCLYRYQVERLLKDSRLLKSFVSAITTAETPEDMLKRLSKVCISASSLCMTDKAPEESRKRAALCFAVHAIDAMQDVRPRLQSAVTNKLVGFLKGSKIH
ncbi:DNA double-strand break repair helicase HerA [uncultured archaeon]|nr:DNA double-strand break repair helicase HerA [uncultured archaeon]